MLTREIVLVVAEGHEHYRQQYIHCRSARQVSPLESEVVPLEYVGTAEDDHNYYQWKEPLGVEQFLPTAPISVYYVAKQEEVEIPHSLNEATDIEPMTLVRLWICEPGGHVEGSVSSQSYEP